jgi:transcriptional regulator with XRE-family HTH domain
MDGHTSGIVVSAEERLEYLARGIGSNRVAELLGVSKSQPSRWRSGQESMSADSRRRLHDLDYVWSRLLLLYPAKQAEIWLTSHNAVLGGRPIDVLRTRGAGPVVAALDAVEQGATS